MTEGLGIIAAINRVKRALTSGGGIAKNGKAMGYAFRGIEDIDAVLCGLTAEHGIVVCPRVTNREVIHGLTKNGGYNAHVYLTVDWAFTHEDGSSVTVTTVGEAMDTQDKAANKAMQAARKYAYILTFMIPVAGDDTEIYVPEPAARVATIGSSRPAEPGRIPGIDTPIAMQVARENMAAPAADPIAAQVTNGALLPVAPAEPKPAPRQGKPGVRGPNKPKPVAPPAEITHPAEVLNGTAPTEPAHAGHVVQPDGPDALLGLIGDTNTFPLLFAVASDADKAPEPFRTELMTAVKHRAVLLFADAKDMAGVREGFELVKAMGSPDELKHAANTAYGRFRNKS